MASSPTIRADLTLEAFLDLPEIDSHPYLEYIDGRIVPKVSPSFKHSVLTSGFLYALNGIALPAAIGEALPEPRCSYAGRSIVPDVVFLLEEHIQTDEHGDPSDDILIPPDIHIEIISPKQGVGEAHEKLLHSTAHGCSLGWLVHPYRRTIDEYRPGIEPRRHPDDGLLDGAPVLPGFRLPVADVWGWLRRPRRGGDQGGPG